MPEEETESIPEHSDGERRFQTEDSTLLKRHKKEEEVDWGELKEDLPKKGKERGMKIGDQVGTYGTFMGKRGIYDKRNSLNELTGKEWVQFTKSWFIHNPPARRKQEALHPAKFPETMVVDFIKFFTKKNNADGSPQIVLDPMVGSGSTLVACDLTNRVGVGIELGKKWYDIAKQRCSDRNIVIHGDARDLVQLLKERGIFNVQFCITSPPYWNMLRLTRGHVESAAQQRRNMGMDEYYSESPLDLGNITNYEDYLSALVGIYKQVKQVLVEGGYLVVVCQNILTPNGEMAPFAWDLAKKLSQFFVLKQERLWLQDNKMLGSWGYATTYVSNVHHHYCLIFKKDEVTNSVNRGKSSMPDGQMQR